MVNKIEKKTYEVDEAMLGHDWNENNDDDLGLFCEELQKLCPIIEIKEITGSWNGANNDQDLIDQINENIWLQALENYCIRKKMSQKILISYE